MLFGFFCRSTDAAHNWTLLETRVNSAQTLQNFLHEQQLPADFLEVIKSRYAPLAQKLAANQSHAGRPLLIGINGSQGSGKSTLASLLRLLLTETFKLKSIALSIDDFYLTRQSRLALAQTVHPLLATRGVPGTHDVTLMQSTLQRLAHDHGEVQIPRFDKARDDRYPQAQWDTVTAPLDVIIVEGWCMGTPAQPEEALKQPFNNLEAHEDPDAIWRRYVNRQINEQYTALYQTMDIWIMLQAPSFDCVYRWRLEQEQKLASKLRQNKTHAMQQNRLMSAEQIDHFIQHYQRLTEHSLKKLPASVNYLFQLDPARRIIAASEPRPVALS